MNDELPKTLRLKYEDGGEYDASLPAPCDHVVGYASIHEGGWLVSQSAPHVTGDAFDRFAYCPRCGARLEER